MATLTGKSGGFFKNAKIIWFGIAVLLIFVFVGTLMLLRSAYQTETYYVLNQDIPTRTQITMDMLSPVVTSAGTAPGGTLEMTPEQRLSEREAILSSVQSGSAYTQFPLKAGDVLSPSSVGALSDISVGVPDNWVITSFSVDYNNAVQGRIQRGTYFDIMVVADSGAYYPFVNILALETATGSGTSSAEGQDASGMNASTSIYTVGMSPENAGKLQWLQSFAGGQLKLVLSPRQNEYASPNLLDYSGTFFYDTLRDGVIAPGLLEAKDAKGDPIDIDGDPKTKDFREITDYTFSDVERDQFGRPTAVVENFGFGNAKIPAGATGGDKATNSNAKNQEALEACEADGGYWVDGACADEPSAGGTPSVNPDDALIDPDAPLSGDTGSDQ